MRRNKYLIIFCAVMYLAGTISAAAGTAGTAVADENMTEESGIGAEAEIDGDGQQAPEALNTESKKETAEIVFPETERSDHFSEELRGDSPEPSRDPSPSSELSGEESEKDQEESEKDQEESETEGTGDPDGAGKAEDSEEHAEETEPLAGDKEASDEAAADKTSLAGKLEKAQELLTPESVEKNRFPDWAVWDLEGAVAQAEVVMKDPEASREEIRDACDSLDTMIRELLDSARTPDNMREQVEAVLAAYSEYYLNPDCFTESSFLYFKSCYEYLEEILAKDSVKVYEYQKAMDEIHEAASQLVMASEISKSALEELAAEVQDLENLRPYLSEEYLSEVDQVYQEAELLLKKVRVTQEEIDAVSEKLRVLLEDLKIQAGKEEEYYRYRYEQSEKERYPERAYTEESFECYRQGKETLERCFKKGQACRREEWDAAWEMYLSGVEQLNLKNEFSPNVIDLRELYDKYVIYLDETERFTDYTNEQISAFINAAEKAGLDEMTDLEAQELLDQANSISWVYSAAGLMEYAKALQLKIESLEREGVYAQTWIDVLRSSQNMLMMDIRREGVEYEVLEELSQVVVEVNEYVRGMDEYELLYLDAEVIRDTIQNTIQEAEWKEFMDNYAVCPQKYCWLTRDSAVDACHQAEESLRQDSYLTKEDYLDILILLRASREGIILTMDEAPLWLRDARSFLKKESKLVGCAGGLSREDYNTLGQLALRLEQGISAEDVILLENTQKEILQFENNIRRLSAPEETEPSVPEETATPVPQETAAPGPEETVTPVPQETVVPEPEETAAPEPGAAITSAPGNQGENSSSGKGKNSGEESGNLFSGGEEKRKAVSTSDRTETGKFFLLLFMSAVTLAAVQRRIKRRDE